MAMMKNHGHLNSLHQLTAAIILVSHRDRMTSPLLGNTSADIDLQSPGSGTPFFFFFVVRGIRRLAVFSYSIYCQLQG